MKVLSTFAKMRRPAATRARTCLPNLAPQELRGKPATKRMQVTTPLPPRPLEESRHFSEWSSLTTSCDLHNQHTIAALQEIIGPLDCRPQLPPTKPLVIVISGPSGVGKDAVIRKLKQRSPDLHFVVTATSRPMRPGEIDGRDYFFVGKEMFEDWIVNGQLLEHALVYGEYKGIPRQQVDEALKRGTDVVLRVDVQGAATMRRLFPDCVSIFIAADNEAALVERLVARKTEPLDKMLTRIMTARDEARHIQQFDYVVANRDGHLEECVGQISSIIEVEKLRVARRYPGQESC